MINMICFLKKYKVILIILLSLIILFFVLTDLLIKEGVDVVSVSSDGQYAITTDEHERAILWDLTKHNSRVLDKKAHIFSAYFIPDTNDYLWQDQKKNIHIRNLVNQNKEDFKIPFFTLSQVMTKDQKYYMIGDIAEGLHLRHNGNWQTLYEAEKGDNGEGLSESNVLFADKPFNLTLSLDQKTFLSSYFGAILRSMETGKLLHDYEGLAGKSFATLSPDGQYVVAGDEGGGGYVWETITSKKLFELYHIGLGKYVKTGKGLDDYYFDSSVLPVMAPNNFDSNGAILALKFIDKSHYLRFSLHGSFAILYEVTNPAPIKYFDLGQHPFPATNYYAKNQAIDTSWQSHILVMGKEDEEGILVYQYDPEKQTLTKVWDGRSCFLTCVF
jgi:WD40 repeat protein